MQSPLHKAIQSAQQSEVAYSKYITANDTGNTGGHQAGFHIHKNAWPLFFDQPGVRGENKDKCITIDWQNYRETESRFIYYGRFRSMLTPRFRSMLTPHSGAC